MWRWRRLSPFGSCLLVLLVAAGTASAAQAADWRGIALPMTDPIHSKLLGISCPSPSLCVAVGETSVVATSTHPGEGASAWHSDRLNVASAGSEPGRGLQSMLYSVSCPSERLSAATCSECAP